MKKQIDFKVCNKVVVRTMTKKASDDLRQLLDDLGSEWFDGDKYTDLDVWSLFKEDTCYNVHEGRYDNIDNCIKNGYIIMDAEQFIAIHKSEEQQIGYVQG